MILFFSQLGLGPDIRTIVVPSGEDRPAKPPGRADRKIERDLSADLDGEGKIGDFSGVGGGTVETVVGAPTVTQP